MTEQRTDVSVSHVLRLNQVDLLGGYRSVGLQRGLNIVRGDITTGKTTFVLLIRALLGAIPRHLPPETSSVRAIAADVDLGERSWKVLRPIVTTRETPVEAAEVVDDKGDLDTDGVALRLPAAGSGGYGEFLLTQLDVPVVYVPTSRADPTSDLSPVTINDWLNYCIVTGDELDTQVFGHRETFRNHKRRWVFEILYDLYDKELAALNAEARLVGREIVAAVAERDVIAKFLVDSQVGDRHTLEVRAEAERGRLSALSVRRAALALEFNHEPAGEIASLREQVLDLRQRLDGINSESRSLDAQIRNLSDLERELSTLSKRLTRSIVADEWMVDFEFVVCPRCGQDLDQHRTKHPVCYLCEQVEPEGTPNREVLLREQDRVTFQIKETEQLLAQRTSLRDQVRNGGPDIEDALRETSTRLDRATAEFVSSHAAELQAVASEEADATANIEWIRRMLTLFAKHDDQDVRLEELRGRLEVLQEQIEQQQLNLTAGEEHIVALEDRMLAYLEELNVPTLSDLLTVRINRKTYLPEVSTRDFDELSALRT